jgi:hypothetical protein
VGNGNVSSQATQPARRNKKKEKKYKEPKQETHERVLLEANLDKSNLHELDGQKRHELGASARHTKSKPEKRGVS